MPQVACCGGLPDAPLAGSTRTGRLGGQLAAALRDHRRRQLEERLAEAGDGTTVTTCSPRRRAAHSTPPTSHTASTPRSRLPDSPIKGSMTHDTRPRLFGWSRARNWPLCRGSWATRPSRQRRTCTAISPTPCSDGRGTDRHHPGRPQGRDSPKGVRPGVRPESERPSGQSGGAWNGGEPGRT